MTQTRRLTLTIRITKNFYKKPWFQPTSETKKTIRSIRYGKAVILPWRNTDGKQSLQAYKEKCRLCFKPDMLCVVSCYAAHGILDQFQVSFLEKQARRAAPMHRKAHSIMSVTWLLKRKNCLRFNFWNKGILKRLFKDSDKISTKMC